jgi:multiple sugar transport system permease protein
MSLCGDASRASRRITVAVILAFNFSWNNFIFDIELASRSTRTLPIAYNVRTFKQIGRGLLAPSIVTAPVLLPRPFYAKGNRC